MNCDFLFDSSGRKVKNTGPLRKLFDFPLFVGKKWKDQTRSITPISKTEATFITDFQIEGVEEVTTPAGTFKTFKISYTQTVVSPSRGSGWVRYWYSPRVKMWVKREVEKAPIWAAVKSLQDTDLISYELK
jgi:hypothetical protein